MWTCSSDLTLGALTHALGLASCRPRTTHAQPAEEGLAWGARPGGSRWTRPHPRFLPPPFLRIGRRGPPAQARSRRGAGYQSRRPPLRAAKRVAPEQAGGCASGRGTTWGSRGPAGAGPSSREAASSILSGFHPRGRAGSDAPGADLETAERAGSPGTKMGSSGRSSSPRLASSTRAPQEPPQQPREGQGRKAGGSPCEDQRGPIAPSQAAPQTRVLPAARARRCRATPVPCWRGPRGPGPRLPGPPPPQGRPRRWAGARRGRGYQPPPPARPGCAAPWSSRRPWLSRAPLARPASTGVPRSPAKRRQLGVRTLLGSSASAPRGPPCAPDARRREWPDAPPNSLKERGESHRARPPCLITCAQPGTRLAAASHHAHPPRPPRPPRTTRAPGRHPPRPGHRSLAERWEGERPGTTGCSRGSRGIPERRALVPTVHGAGACSASLHPASASLASAPGSGSHGGH